jgi:hypothetical protein
MNEGWLTSEWSRVAAEASATRLTRRVGRRRGRLGPGAHSQGETLDELTSSLQEVVEMLLEDGEPRFESEFVGVQTIQVA